MEDTIKDTIKALIMAPVVIFGGVGLIYRALKRIKLHRRIKDTPTSKINSAAIGKNVEVVGKVVCDLQDLIQSPLSERKGYAFIWELDEFTGKQGGFANMYKFFSNSYINDTDGDGWINRYKYYSTPFIYLKDSSDAIAAVDIAACEFSKDIFDHTAVFCDMDYDLPEGVRHLLDVADIIDTSREGNFIRKSHYRLREKIFRVDELFFIFGTALTPPREELSKIKSPKLRFGGKRYKLTNRIRALFKDFKSNSKLREMCDFNQDGYLDPDEDEALNRTIEKKILNLYLPKKGAAYLAASRFLFSQDTNSEAGLNVLNRVLVSKNSEKKTLSKLSRYNDIVLLVGIAFIVFGVTMIVAGISFFLDS
jgi:hypothetical protein